MVANVKKHPLIVEVSREEDETWTVYPVPGFVVKFKDARFPALSTQLLVGDDQKASSSKKFFLNIAHCTELPSPKHDWDEDEAAKALDSYKIPLSLGELDQSIDNQGEAVSKVDVLINSTFFHKRIEGSEFFRQLLIMTACQAVESRHGVILDTAKQVILRNKKVMGELNSQKIRKKPSSTFERVSGRSNEDEHAQQPSGSRIEVIQNSPDDTLDDNSLELLKGVSQAASKPRNYRVQVVNGKTADIRVKVRDQNDELVHDVERLTLKMNVDRCAVILDGSRTVVDFFLPYYMLDNEAKCEFDSAAATLTIKCPIDWKQ